MAEKGTIISGIGMMTAVGIGAKQTAASVRAGISRFSETSICDKHFDPFVMSILPDEVLPPVKPEIDQIVGLTARQLRMLRLAAPALEEVLADTRDIEKIPIYLGVPEPLQDRPKVVDDEFIKYLGMQTGFRFNVGESELFPLGRASGLAAIQKAMQVLSSGDHQHVIVGGVDTYLDLYLLGTLDMENRILGNFVMDGFIPGEGAGFLLLSSPDVAEKSGENPVVQIQAVGVGYESGHLYSEEIYQGNGLSEAFQAAFDSSDTSLGNIRSVFAGLNGENFGAKEWGVAYLRSKSYFEEEFRLEHPIDCFGDTGAALGPLMTGLSAIGMKKNYIESPCLIWCSSDYGTRAALTMALF
ncbi:beta-ketoacyl synthase N-terminal-like domain-containing protein [Desulfonema magnum]|uniref:Beta-ketoacyl-acyl synthase N-terminal domain-containing protein n=1 Tax=Desulfonema magnum TaxID=45655 RepID=A0A975BI45_9BACT|nr:beta-ketoacyl synthase N-terminal-like domain-containing protein [Desulfonema magnum]QTA85817.1 Beta-ketoacyl-acyl synthase N-terminal domain-containing protein [Desulfonema magnum]